MIHIKLTIMALLWAGGFIASKVIAPYAGPFTISFLRFLTASVVLSGLICVKEKDVRFDKRLLAYAFGAAFLGIVCYNYFFFAGIRLIDAGRGSVIIGTVPVAVALFSHTVLKERLSILKMAGITLSVLGAWVVVSKGDLAGIFLGGIGRGEAYLTVCVICAAAFALFSKKLLQELKPLAVMLYISVIGTVLMLVPALVEIRQTVVDLASPVFLSNLLYLAVGPSVVAVIFYYEAIHLVGTSRASQYMNLIPVFAVVLATVFLGEHLTFSLLAGGCLVTAGLYVTNLNA